jgi:hypothetical protein
VFSNDDKWSNSMSTSQVLLPSLFLPGMIIPYAGPLNALDLDEWALCDGSDVKRGAPDLSGLFLIGTGTWSEVGHRAGTPTHSHHFSVNSPNMMQAGNGDARGYNIDVQDHPPAVCGMDHWHHISGSTDEIAWTPPSHKVMFIMRCFPKSGPRVDPCHPR